ncbi:MAG: GNAT family N-acetyltransferase [bacterium]|nr:GNAT family N-acetyltransferase [bacterium]
MIIPVSGRGYAGDFAAVYNSANTLFPQNERSDADETVFYPQLERDNNYIYTDGDEICAFMSCRSFEEYRELTSLYVKRECQRKKIGRELLRYFEEAPVQKAPAGREFYFLVKVLRNAEWALDFYKKHGYEPLNEKTRGLICRWNMTEKAWENILIKNAVT